MNRDVKKRTNPIYILLLSFFALNVFDYSLLSFEFSMGVEQTFGYSEEACIIYQVPRATSARTTAVKSYSVNLPLI